MNVALQKYRCESNTVVVVREGGNMELKGQECKPISCWLMFAYQEAVDSNWIKRKQMHFVYKFSQKSLRYISEFFFFYIKFSIGTFAVTESAVISNDFWNKGWKSRRKNCSSCDEQTSSQRGSRSLEPHCTAVRQMFSMPL
jgi:hypothetical protein